MSRYYPSESPADSPSHDSYKTWVFVCIWLSIAVLVGGVILLSYVSLLHLDNPALT